MLEFLLTPSPLGGLFVFVAVGLAGAGFVLWLRQLHARSVPARVLQAVEALDDRVHQHEQTIERLRGDWTVFQENSEAVLESVERKRRQAAARRSRNGEPGATDPEEAPAPVSQEDQLRAIKARIYGGANPGFGQGLPGS